MEQLLIDSLRQELENLRNQTLLIQNRIDEIQTTLGSLEAECMLSSSVPEHNPLPEDEQPEVEVEFYVDDFNTDYDGLLTDEELEVEDSVEEVILQELEKEPEPVAEPAPEPIVEEQPAIEPETPQEPEPAPKPAEKPAPVAEPVAEPAPKPAADPAAKQPSVSLPPIDDIRKGMSLGDRFLFQRELFAGDGEKMNKTIDRLNGCSTLEEALQYTDKHFKWDTESQSYQLFVNLLKRRF